MNDHELDIPEFLKISAAQRKQAWIDYDSTRKNTLSNFSLVEPASPVRKNTLSNFSLVEPASPVSNHGKP